MDIKKKLASVIDHVKSHQIPYTIAATTAVCAAVVVIAEKNYFDSRHLIDLNESVAKMRGTGKGMYFDMKDGGTVAMILEEFLDEPLDRLN